ncbi:MAG: VWA domain-containing protein [Myxococcota bacterium]
MNLTGLTLAEVLTAFAAVGAAVVVLYLLKLRRRRIEVPFVSLWNQVLAEKQTTRLFSQLKRWLSLLIALLVVAALSFALGDPRLSGATEAGRTVVLLVDGSASMQTTDAQGSRFDRAKAIARTLVEELGPADRMLVAQLDATATPLTPLTDEPRILKDAIEELSPTEVGANLRAGLRVSLDVLRDEPNAEVVLLSDGVLDETRFDTATFGARLEEAGVRLSWTAIGQRDDNVAIAAFSVRRYPLDKSQSEVLVELYNAGDEDRVVELELKGDGSTVDVQRITLAAGEHLRRFFRNVSGVDATMEAALRVVDGEDPLEADNHAFARLPERRRARVLVVSAGNLYLQAALLLDEYLDVTEQTPSQYGGAEGYDVVIFDNWVPPATPETAALYLNPVSDDPSRGPFVVRGTLEGPYFENVRRRHPLVKWTALGDVNIVESLEIEMQSGDRAVASSEGDPLIVTGSRAGRRFVAFTFDMRQSDLPLRVAWPLLLLNTIDYFVQEQAGFVSSYATGDTWRIPAPAGDERATILLPDGAAREVPVEEGRAVFAGLRAGFHTLRTSAGDEVFAANLGAGVESDIKPPETLSVGSVEAAPPTRGKVGLRREIWLYLVLAVLGILCAEWFTYHRRLTV